MLCILYAIYPHVHTISDIPVITAYIVLLRPRKMPDGYTTHAPREQLGCASVHSYITTHKRCVMCIAVQTWRRNKSSKGGFSRVRVYYDDVMSMRFCGVYLSGLVSSIQCDFIKIYMRWIRSIELVWKKLARTMYADVYWFYWRKREIRPFWIVILV